MYLNNHTYYSLRYGTISPTDLLKYADKNGIRQLVVTDINTTSACLEIARKALRYNIKPIFGVDFRNGISQLYVAIAKNNEGFQEINNYLTQFLSNKTSTETGVKRIPPKAPEFKNVFVVYPYMRNVQMDLSENEYLGVSLNDIDHIRINKADTSKMVVLKTVTFRNKKDFNAHRLLRAIDKNTLLSKLPVSEQACEEHRMIPKNKLERLFDEYPLIVKNTQHILEVSSVYFDMTNEAPPQNQRYYTNSIEEDVILIEKLCQEGLNYRYPNLVPEDVRERLDMELKTIKKMKFTSYFLINWDIVSYARSKGYYYVGRGSGANSLVAYLFRITDVDPIELNLYFERFINLFRANPPDFDIDFSWTDREDVTAYIFERFRNVALVATYNTFQARSVQRELGKVFGLPKFDVDKICNGTLQDWEQNEITQLVIKYSRYIHNFPSHLSIHASGIIISEKPVNYFTPTFMPPKGYPTIQFDMHIAEDVGLYKFDILSQRGLGKIKDTLKMLKLNQSLDFDIHDVSALKEDEKIKTLLKTANAVGCFYVESPAMRMLLRKLEVDTYLGLVAASSVIRPGVAQSGMMQTYIQRFRHPEKRKEAHPELLKLMPETYGVMVYQEDVIKVAHHFAGLDLGEADKMRRGMSGKYRSREEFEAVRTNFFAGAKKNGHPIDLVSEVWRQTESFAGYAFAKGHSASYAVESYQSLFLKAYYPLEYMVATVNNFGGFYSSELYLLEAKKHGATLHAPCVNKSFSETKLYGKDIYIGFVHLKSLEQRTVEILLRERMKNGLFESFNDFLDRVSISIEQISILIRIDAFRFIKKDKRTLLWEANLKLGVSKSSNLNVTNETLQDLFQVERSEFQIPSLDNSMDEDTFDQIELLGFPLNSPYSILRPDGVTNILAKDLPRYINQEVWVKGYLIHRKKTSTKSGNSMFFGTLLDEKGEWIDTVHFPEIAKKFLFRGKGVYKIKGVVREDYECITVEVNYMEKMSVIEDPRYKEIRDEAKEKEVVTRNRRIDYFLKK